jgi:hypothetical protein
LLTKQFFVRGAASQRNRPMDVFKSTCSLSVLRIEHENGETLQDFPVSGEGFAVYKIMKNGNHYQALIGEERGTKEPVDVPANGDCFFHSLQLVLGEERFRHLAGADKNEDVIAQLRRRVCGWMIANPDAWTDRLGEEDRKRYLNG